MSKNTILQSDRLENVALDLLPDELKVQVLINLPPAELLKMRTISSGMRTFVDEVVLPDYKEIFPLKSGADFSKIPDTVRGLNLQHLSQAELDAFDFTPFKKLSTVYLPRCTKAQHIAKLPITITELVLDTGAQIKDANFSHLTALRLLSLNQSQADSQTLATVPNTVEIMILNACTLLQNADLSQFTNLRTLVAISSTSKNMLETLSDTLEELDLRYSINSQNELKGANLSHLTKLRVLRLDGNGLSSETLLTASNQLQELYLTITCDYSTKAVLSHFDSLRVLKTQLLTPEEVSLVPATMEELYTSLDTLVAKDTASLSADEEHDIAESVSTEEEDASLSDGEGFNRFLASLDAGYAYKTWNDPNEQIDNADFSHLENLRILQLKESHLNAETLLTVSSKLRELILKKSQLDNLDDLSHFKNLRVLNLHKTNITAEALETLTTGLNQLDITQTRLDPNTNQSLVKVLAKREKSDGLAVTADKPLREKIDSAKRALQFVNTNASHQSQIG